MAGMRNRAAQADDDSTEFLNVDLEVFSRERLTVFVSGLGRSVHVLHEGRWGRRRYAACLELWTSGYGQTPDHIVQGMVRLLKKMPRPAKVLWNRAQTRRFNIGIQAAFKPRSFELPLRPATVKAVTDVGAQLLITVYAQELLPPVSKDKTPPNKAADGRREEAPTQRQLGLGAPS